MTPIRLLAAIMNSLRSFRVLLRRDVRVAFGLIAHERDPAVLHDRHVRVHLGLVHLLAAHGDAALVEALDAGRATEHRHRSEEHTSELQSRQYLVCRLLLEKKKKKKK